MKLKRGNMIFAAVCLTVSLVLLLFFIKYSGFIVTTISRVNIDNGIIVFAGEFSGSTTNFLYMNDSELGMIESMVLENPEYGKIIFNETINLTKEAVANIVDLDSNVNISLNRIEVNTTSLTGLAKAATLYLYNLTFSDPRILNNGVLCGGACQIISYSPGGTLTFNVSNFSGLYSAEETPGGTVTPPGGGGGGGGGGGALNFALDTSLIKVSFEQGETKRETIRISNIGKTIMNIVLTPELVGKFMAISEDSFSLKPGEAKTVNVDFFAKENEIPDSYIGRIIVDGNGVKKSINIIIEVKEKKAIFDISTEVTPKEINAGGQINANINITNMGNLKNIDVTLYYAVKDFQQNILSFKEENLLIENNLNIQRSLRVPVDAPFGAYAFYSKVSYGNVSASSTDTFMVSNRISIVIPILISLILLLIVIIYLLERKNKKDKFLT